MGGLFWGFTIVAVTAAVLYEVVARTVFGRPRVGGNETTIYLSAMAYLLAGGYACSTAATYASMSSMRRWAAHAGPPRRLHLRLLPRLHADADLRRRRRRLELVPDRRDDEHAVEPVVWPVKAAIPAAGLLLLLQGVANLIRDMGWAPGGTAR
jgi:TRAP-type C4-dicarboxylate transport system permease small subunit